MNSQTQKNLLHIVQSGYKKIAKDFSETRKKYLWPELIKLTKNVKNNDKVLDVGCGNGRLISAFKNKKIDYLGVDNNQELINIAKSMFTKFKFLRSDILELGKISNINFDYVFCIDVLHHLPGENLRILAIKQLKNKIKNNGKIVLTVWNLWNQKKYKKLILKFAILKILKKNKMDFGDILFDWKNIKTQPINKRYYHAFTKRELKRIVKKAGLNIEKIYKDRYNYYIVLSK